MSDETLVDQPGGRMTRDDLVQRLEAVKHCIYNPYSQAAEDEAERAIDDAIAALTAPPLTRQQREAVERMRAVSRDYDLLDPVHDLGREVHEAVRSALEVLARPTPAAPQHPFGCQCGCSYAAPPADLVALVREWQEARKPTVLATPGEFLAETFQAAVRRMSAADEALAACRLDVAAAAETPAAVKRVQTPNEADTGNEGDEKIGDVDGGGAGRVLPSLREELAEIIRWRFRTADGEIMDGVTMLKAAQEIADAIAPYIEEATGGR